MKFAQLIILIFLAVLTAFLGPFGCGEAARQDSPPLSVAAPDFELENFAGGKVNLSDYRGRVVLLNFWATWCRPCVAETPDLVDLYKKYRDRGLVVLGVSVDRNPRAVLYPFIQKNKIDYPILLVNQRVASDYGGLTSIPTTFLIDREGIIRQQYVGYRPKSVFEEAIKELL